MLLKDIGARFGGAGTTAAGAAVVQPQIAAQLRHPAHGSTTARACRAMTAPPRVEIVSLLSDLANNAHVHRTRWRWRARPGRWPARCAAPARAGPLPRQDRHAARRRQRGRLLHGAGRPHARLRVPDERARRRRLPATRSRTGWASRWRGTTASRQPRADRGSYAESPSSSSSPASSSTGTRAARPGELGARAARRRPRSRSCATPSR